MLVLPKPKITDRFHTNTVDFFEEILNDEMPSSNEEQENENTYEYLKLSKSLFFKLFLRSFSVNKNYEEKYISENFDYSEKSELLFNKLAKTNRNITWIQNKSSLYNQYYIESQKMIEYMKKNQIFFRSLEKNWDEDGAKSFSEENISLFKSIILDFFDKIWEKRRILISIPKILPNHDGTINVIWQMNNGILGIKIEGKNEITYYGLLNKGMEFGATSDEDHIVDILVSVWEQYLYE